MNIRIANLREKIVVYRQQYKQCTEIQNVMY